ncbi:MAG: hypothetical protein ABFS18_02120 [Thermodesulfobacteriota bacterium]
MSWREVREAVAKTLAPGLKDETELREIVKEEVVAARLAMPVNLDYDPQGEGYRKIGGDAVQRDLTALSQDMMLELAYRLYDTSGLVKRFVRDTKNFVLGEGVSFEIANDNEAGDALAWVNEFWNDSYNQMAMRLEKRIEFLGLLGEQCWPTSVEPNTGKVRLTYVDPANIDEVHKVKFFPEMTAAVKLKGNGGRSGATLTSIREESDWRSPGYGYLMGDCFFFSINDPPNGTRGRSDLVHLFDFIDNFEEGLFDELDRIRQAKAFVWDVTLKGGDENDIRDFLKNNKQPKPGSMRVHNEQVEWDAVAPDLKHSDNKAVFDLMKTYLSACMNRPDSWLGSGGKAYQTEADLMGAPTFKDLGSRQRYVKYMLEYVLQFVLDQAVLAGTLKETDGKRLKATVNMPEMNDNDLEKTVSGLLTLSQGLAVAQVSGWISEEGAAKVFLAVAGQVGVDLDVAAEIQKAAAETDADGNPVTKDYQAREGLMDKLMDIVKVSIEAQNRKGPESD